MRIFALLLLTSFVAAVDASPSFAQCASCGAEYNQRERARLQAIDHNNQMQTERALQNANKPTGGRVDTRRVGKPNQSTADKPSPKH
jgi:hypothetical protein